MLRMLHMVSWRRLAHAPARAALVIAGIALGVATFVGTTAVNRAIEAAFGELVAQVGGRADLVVTAGEIGVPADLVEAIAHVPGVAHVSGLLEITSRRAHVAEPIRVLGVDYFGDRWFLPLSAEDGQDVLDDPIEVANDPTAILISGTLAAEAGVGVGGEIDLLTPQGVRPFRVRAILARDGLGAVFGGRVAVMFTEAAQRAFARGDRVDRIEIAVEGGRAVNEVQAAIASALEGRGRVEAPGERTRHLAAITAPIRRGLASGGAIALLVGMFLVFNAVGVAVGERRREIGVLRALGVSRGRVVGLFALEAGALAVAGGLAGLPLGRALATFALPRAAPTVSRFYAPIRPLPPELTPDLALAGLLAGLAAALLAAVLAARSAARVDPVESLRGAPPLASVRPHEGRGRRALLVAGGCFTAAVAVSQLETPAASLAALLLVLAGHLALVPQAVSLLARVLSPAAGRLFGLSGRLGVENARRALGRSALTVGALMTAVSSSVAIASWGGSLVASIYTWLERALPADLYVTSGSFIADQHNVPFEPEVSAKIRALPGVEAAYPVRMIGVDVGERHVELAAIDMEIYLHELARKGAGGRASIEGPPAVDPAALLARASVVVSENAARKLGVHAGDRLELVTPTGRQSFEVYAIVVDYTSDQGTVLVDWKWFRAYFRDELVDTVDVFLADGADPAAVRAAIREVLGGGDTLFVVGAGEVRREIRAVISQAVATFASSELLALVVALLGVVGTMLAAVLDRVREIGVLRAVGATRRQVVAAAVVEASFLGVAAALAGVVAGIPMGMVFVRVVGLAGTGWHVDYVFPALAAARVALLVVVTAGLAGLLPGRHAARIRIGDALAYE